MVANDNAGSLTPRGAFATIASLLAPTEVIADINKRLAKGAFLCRSEYARDGRQR